MFTVRYNCTSTYYLHELALNAVPWLRQLSASQRGGPVLIPGQPMWALCRTTRLKQVFLRLLRFSPVSYNSTNAQH